MELLVTDLGNAAKLALHGRLDTAGVDKIETRFTASVVPAGRHAVVDLSGVTFVSSMGIRMLLASARALRLKQAKMVIFGAQQIVRESLDHASINTIIPVVDSEAAALDLLKS